MTRTGIIMVVLFFLSAWNYASAQRYDNTNSISASGIGSTGIGAVIEYERILYNGNTLFINASVYSLKKDFDIIDDRAELMDYMLAIGYRKYFDIPNPAILPYFSVAPFVGYQTIPNKDDLPGSVKYAREEEMLYGGNIEVGVEYNFGKFSVFAGFSPCYEVKYKDLNPNVKIGLKLLIQ